MWQRHTTTYKGEGLYMIADILPRYQEVANGSKKAFTYTFDTIDSSYINVYLGTTRQTSGFSISGKTVTFTTAPASSTVVTIVRVIPTDWEQEVLGAVNKDSLNKIFTNIIAKMQTLKEELSRAVKTDVTDTETGSAHFLSMLSDAMDSLGQANTKYAQVLSSATQALSDIDDAKSAALAAINGKVRLTGYSAHNGSTATTPYKKLGSIVMSGANRTSIVPFVATRTNCLRTSPFLGRISLRTGSTAGTITTSVTGIIFEDVPDYINNEDIKFYILYKYAVPTANDVTFELWVYVKNTYQGITIIPLRQGAGGVNISSTDWTWADNTAGEAELPTTDYTGQIAQIITSGYTATPSTSDNSNKKATTAFVKAQGYLTGITASNVTTALGYTPLQASDISNMMTTDTDQTVTAKKVLGGSNLTMISQSGITKGTNPATTQYINFGLMGTGTSAYTDRLGCVETSVDASGNVITYLRAYKNTASSSTEAHISVHYPASGSAYAEAPTPTEDTTSSVQIDTVGARNTKLSSYALLSSGNVFTSNQTISKGGPVLNLKNTNITRATAPESQQSTINILGKDSADKGLWGIYHRYYTSMENRVDLICYKGITTDGTWTSIAIGYDSSGNAYTKAVTPVVTSNSTDIATTAYTRSYVSSRGDLVLFGTSSTAADTTAKVVDLNTVYNPSNISIRAGQLLVVVPTTTSTVADSTLKVQITIDGTTTQVLAAKTMKYNNANITTSTDSIVWTANVPSIFVYDGSYWQFLGHGLDNNTTYSAMSVSEGTTGTATSSRVVRADYLKQIIEGLAISQTNTYYDSSSSTLYIG